MYLKLFNGVKATGVTDYSFKVSHTKPYMSAIFHILSIKYGSIISTCLLLLKIYALLFISYDAVLSRM